MVHTYHGGILHGLGIHGIMTHGTGIHGTTPDGTALGDTTGGGIGTRGMGIHGTTTRGIMTHGTGGIHGTPAGTALGVGTMQGIMTLGTTDIMEDGMGIIMDITMLGGKAILAESPGQDKIWATVEAGAQEMLSQEVQEVI